MRQVGLLLLFAVFGQCQDESARLRAAGDLIDTMAHRALKESGAPGMAVAITSRKGLIWQSNFGFANRDARTPVTPETEFGIGSIGKSFTAVSILQLRDEGKLDPQAPVSRCLPWFRVNSTIPITPHHLMTHTSGLPAMRMELMSSLYQVMWLKDAPFQFVPEKQYHYSSAAFDVLSTLIETLSRQSYAEFVKQNILQPLEMNDSEPVFVTRIRPKLAVSYEPMYDDRPSHRGDPLIVSNWYEYGGGAGSVAATARDLAAYVRMILNRGQGPKGRLLSEESFKLLTQHAIRLGEDQYYGYGVQLTESDGRRFVGHGGGVQGFHSTMLADMDGGIAVVALTNGPANVDSVGRFALVAVTAAMENRELPALPPPASFALENAGDYAGDYVGPAGRKLTVLAEGKQLTLEYDNRRLPLDSAGKDAFLCGDSGFALYPIRFRRENQEVVELYYGQDSYANARYKGRRNFDSPPEWETYPGHYRTSTRQHVNFRIVLRKGALWFVSAAGDETMLIQDKPGTFRVGDTPEWLRFDELLNGKTMRANYSGTDYHRDFTP